MTMPPEQRLGLHIKRAEQELMAAKTAALRPFGLTVPQYSALLLVGAAPGISAAALARECLVTPQTMATVLTNLEAKHLVTRAPHPYHRNATELALTTAGQKLLAKADKVASGIERDIADAFTPAERKKLVEMLARVSARLADSARDSAAGR